MKNILIAWLLGSFAVLNAQTVGGVVSDENGPLAGVSIFIPELQRGTITNTNGQYELNNLPKSTLKIVYSFVGYSTQSRDTKITESVLVDILLQRDAHQMDEVIVSSAFSRLQSQNVMKVDYVTVESLQQQGAISMMEGLASSPGVNQISTGASIGKPVVRGLTGNRVVVYSQGIRLENQQFGDEHGLGLSDSGVESVEIIKGPATLLYGSDAMGGVLYFNPEKFANANDMEADFSQRFYSNTLGSSSSVGFKQSGEKWKYSMRGNYATHSDYKTPKFDRVENTRFNETDLKVAVGYTSSDFSSVLRYTFGALDLGIPEGEMNQTSTSKNTQNPFQHVNSHMASLHNNFFFKNSKLENTIGFSQNNRKEFEDGEAALDMKLRTLSYDFKYHFAQMKGFSSIIGIQGMYQENENFGEELLIPDATTTDFGIFTTANYEWKKHTILAGFRFDHRAVTSDEFGEIGEEGYFQPINKPYNSLNASLGYKVQIAEPTTIRLNLVSGFRAPNLAELLSNGVHEGTNRYEVGNANLKTEQNFQADLNVDYKISHFDLFINGFYNHINKYIFIAPSQDFIAGNRVYNYDQQDAMLFGGEVGFHYHPHPFDWLHFESSFEMVRGEKRDGGALPYMPANNWHNTIRAEFSKSWINKGFARIDVTSTFKQNQVTEFETPTGSYALLSASVGGRISFGGLPVDVSISGQNLFNKTYFSHLSRLKSDGIPNIGRNVMLGLKFNLI